MFAVIFNVRYMMAEHAAYNNVNITVNITNKNLVQVVNGETRE